MEALNHNPHHVPAHQENLRNIVLALYIMFVAGFFTGGLTFIVALIMAHVKKSDSVGTIYQSHVSSYLTVAWVNMGTIVIVGPLAFLLFVLMLSKDTGTLGAVLFVTSIAILLLVAMWSIYRICKGVLRWSEKRAVI